MKLWERVVKARLRKYRDGQRELHCVFVDLEKVYDRVPREELWYCMRKSGVAEKYVRVVQDMYERSRTVVSESREQVEENLERWRFALERRGMKVSRSKTEYMCVNEREGSGTVRLQGEEVKKVQEFKYLGSTVQSNGECGKELEVTNLLIYQSGKGYKAIFKALGLPQTKVRAIIYKWQKHGTVENLPRSGRLTKITPRAQRQLIQEVTKDPTTTSKELQASLASVK
ncbi:hypothetical protein QTP70_012750 [Hemibagrus guttatus]|uniref:Reverse transcriptase domain-containing protein n=1 Tax=Hemibagrus guttatus TaxID=175788 RepID=A0AAE0R0B6_9TELE|nr:hypothetical protein QTP70_012750 [Hemibagrus guttatus]